MNAANAFLLMTIIAYVIAVYLPKPVIKNLPRWQERIAMLLSGTFLLINLLLNINWLWLLSGCIWTLAALLSYLGYVQWNVLWKLYYEPEPRYMFSEGAQMTMFLWDIAIAVVCFTKV